jgi:hypothetical protein
MSTQLNGQPGELSLTLQITRAATGQTEEVQLTGYLDPEQLAALQAAETETKEQ